MGYPSRPPYRSRYRLSARFLGARLFITKVILMGRIPIFNIWDFCLFSNTKVDQYQQRRNDNGYVPPAVHLYQ